MSELNIADNRAAQKYPPRVQVMRLAWAVGGILFRIIPRPFYAPRRVLLRLFGANIGLHVNIANTATIYFPWNLEIGDWSAIGEHAYIYNLGRITIGEKTTISQRAHLCAGSHEYRDPAMPLLTPPISVGDQAWICADAFVGPNVIVGDGSVIGARAVVCRDVDPQVVVVGNPATVIGTRELKESERI